MVVISDKQISGVLEIKNHELPESEWGIKILLPDGRAFPSGFEYLKLNQFTWQGREKVKKLYADGIFGVIV